MKTGIHPEVFETTVHCNGCNTTFTTHSTVQEINVEICSNCHPFYTGKQKLIDTAGRVDKFKARQAEATKRAQTAAAKTNSKDPEVAKIQEELQSETVDQDATTAEV
jgi:large subunit ribosomal protein L31